MTGNGLVRLTGIDAPETGDGRTIRECFGPEARQWLRGRAPAGTPLILVTDAAERDRFGRLLAYAYRADGASSATHLRRAAVRTSPRSASSSARSAAIWRAWTWTAAAVMLA